MLLTDEDLFKLGCDIYSSIESVADADWFCWARDLDGRTVAVRSRGSPWQLKPPGYAKFRFRVKAPSRPTTPHDRWLAQVAVSYRAATGKVPPDIEIWDLSKLETGGRHD